MRAIILCGQMPEATTNISMTDLKREIFAWCEELGFQQAGVSDIDLGVAESRLKNWLQQKFHGSMSYMERHGTKRSRPEQLIPGTVRVLSVRMDYLRDDQESAKSLLDHPRKAYVSRYALGPRLSQGAERTSA